MLKDIYAIPETEPRYKDNIVEVTSELDEIIQQIDLLLFTKKGDVLMLPNFGCNLEEYLFETTYNEALVRNIILEQIHNFIYLDGTYKVDVDVSFVQWEFNVAMIVDLTINNQKMARYLI